jgi:hypothetical protein
MSQVVNVDVSVLRVTTVSLITRIYDQRVSTTTLNFGSLFIVSLKS